MLKLLLSLRNTRLVHAFIFSLLFSNFVLAEDLNIDFEHLTSVDGLSNDNVVFIKQDNDGLLWFGTEDGLNMYDGYDITVFKPEPGSGINISFIWGMRIDANNTIWIGTRGNGLVLFDINTKEFKAFEYKSGINMNDKIVTDFAFHDSLVWIGCGLHGLITYNRKTTELYKDTLFTRNTGIASYIYKDDVLWLGTRGQGLFKYKLNKKNIEYVNIRVNPKQKHAGFIWDMTLTDDDELMVSYWDRAFVIYDINSDVNNPEFKIIYNSEGILSSVKIKSLTKVQGYYWAATRKGLQRIDLSSSPAKVKVYAPELSNVKSINNLVSQSLLVDKSSNLWIGTREGGVNKIDFNKNKFAFYDATFFSESISPFITFLYPLGDNEFLSGPNLKQFNLKTGEVKSINNIKKYKSPTRALSALKTTISGREIVLIGTWTSGFHFFDITNTTLFDFNSAFNIGTAQAGLYVVDIEKDAQNNIWIGHEQGLRIFTIDTLIKKNLTRKHVKVVRPRFKPKFFSGSNVRCVKSDAEGNIWVGSLKGLVCIKSYNLDSVITDFDIYSPDSTGKFHLKATGVECIFFDSQQNMWLGTVGGGLAKYNKKEESFTYFTSAEGLQADNVIEIIEGDNNILWLSTNRGISSFNPNAPETQQFKNYTVADGLQGAIFNNNAAFKANNGELFFGGPNGLNSFFPNQLLQDTVPPNIILTKLTVFNRDYESGEYEVHTAKLDNIKGIPYLKMYHKDYAFKVNFSALSYSNPQKNQYSYKLVGYDDNWKNVSSEQRFVEYSNIKPGHYRFLLKASNSDGYWTASQTKLNIEIVPPLWQRIWFQLAIIILTITIAIGFYRYRISILKQRQAMLEKKVDERTSELKQANVDLQERQEEIITQNEEIQQQAEELMAQKEALAESHDEIEKSFKRFEMLSEFGQKITATLSIDAIYNMIFSYAKSIIDITAFGIGLYDEKENLIYYPKFINKDKVEENLVKSLNDNRSLTSYCFNKQEIIFVNNMEAEAANYGLQAKEISNLEIARSRIHIPLTVEDKKMGLLVINSEKINAYSKEDLTNMQTLASYISIALDNAKAYDTIHFINKNTEKSINYASTIQNAFLPQPDFINEYVDSFVLFKPKDIVSGDYYWFYPIEPDPEKPTDLIIAAMDCTGHGVPGALMSLVGNTLMRETIIKDKIYEPAQILTELNKGVKETLKQETTGNNDGMDAALARIQQQEDGTYRITFGGAKNPLIVIHKNGEMQSIKGSRASIGGVRLRREKVFEQQEITLFPGEHFYLFSDGYADQNGPTREKFGRENMLKLIQENASYSLTEQHQKLEEAIAQHMQNAEQRDDITMIGISL